MKDVCRYLAEEKGITLSPQQRAAVASTSPAVLLLAVPGSGKTTALVARTARLLLEEGADPRRILTVTFNREAARDLEARWGQLFGSSGLGQPSFSTIHSFCYRVLRLYAGRKGVEPPRVFGEREGSRRVLAGLYREQLGETFGDDELDNLANAIGYATNRMIPDGELARLFPQLPGLEGLRAAYRRYKQQHQLMDFDDMLLYAYTALQRYPALLAQVRGRYDWVQVDEAQDTSLLQHRILELVSQGRIFLVGDEDQSIYRFRGAWPKALLEFRDRYPQGEVLKMEDNFRSTPQIVGAARLFIREYPNRYDKEMQANRPQGPALSFHEEEELPDQYQAIVRQLAALPAGETAAVLYRSAITAAALADRLDREGIPFYCRETKNPLGSSLVLRDLGAIFRLALDPGNVEDFLRVAYKMGCYVTRELGEHLRRCPPDNLWDALVDSDQYQNRSTARLSYLQAVLKNLCRKPPVKAIQAALDDLGYLDYLKKQGEGGYQLEMWSQHIGVARSIAQGCPDLPAFLARLEELPRLLLEANGRTDCPLCLSTVHSAKGREFDRVLLADLIEGVFPASAAIEEEKLGDGEAMEEEARIFYVAITRPRRQLELYTACRQGEVDLENSRFFLQVRDGLLPQAQRGTASQLRPGLGIWHRSFGRGVVTGVNRRMALFTVRFDKLGTKYFSFSSLEDPQTIRVLP